MKIMKAVDKKVGDVVYYKYKINLPKKVEETNLINNDILPLPKGGGILTTKDKPKGI